MEILSPWPDGGPTVASLEHSGAPRKDLSRSPPHITSTVGRAAGETKLGSLVTLCTFHHRLVHEGGFGPRVTDDGVFVFTRPDGSRVDPNGRLQWRFRGNSGAAMPSTPSVSALLAGNRAAGLAIDTRTARSRWLGERMDYSLAIEHLIQVRDRCQTGGAAPTLTE
jgi:hypothetical protein